MVKKLSLTSRMEKAAKRMAKKAGVVRSGGRRQPAKSSLSKTLEYAKRTRPNCRYAVIRWNKGDKVRQLVSCHETLGAAREVAQKIRKESRKPAHPGFGLLRWGASTRLAIYDLRTKKKVPTKRK